MRIYKDRFYVLADHPGISGFQQWDKLEYWVTTGYSADRNRPLVQGELADTSGTYRLHDGHLPECCPVVPFTAAIVWLRANPFQRITRIEGVPVFK